MNHNELKVADNDDLNTAYCPLPLEVIPNHMGINLCSVDSVEWVKQDDGQLVSLTINFNPNPKEEDTSEVSAAKTNDPACCCRQQRMDSNSSRA